MSAALGSVTFDQAMGIITPRTVKVVEDIENPAGIDASLSLDVGQRSTVTYVGWFATTQVAALFALVDTVVSATDEAGLTYTVRVCSVAPRERVAKCDNVKGKWVECVAVVKPWV